MSAKAPERDHGVATLPSISLPKGGGAIRGVDEKLTVGQPTGTASLTVPVFTSPTRQGFGPQLSLWYDSGAGNGPFGLGWNLAVPSITRKTSKGLPRYNDAADSDVFILAGVEDLTPLLVESGGGWVPDRFEAARGGRQFNVRRYRPRVESEFARVEHWEDQADGNVHWRVVSAANVTSVFGQSASSRIADPGDPTRVFSWLLELSFDDRGNAISYEYKAEDSSNVPGTVGEQRRTVTANRYLKRIRYGNETPYVADSALPDEWCFEAVVDYGEHDLENPTPAEVVSWPCREDPFSSYRAGFEIRTYRACQRILMFHNFPELDAAPVIVRSTDLTYSTDTAAPDPGLAAPTLLTAIVHTGWCAIDGGGFNVKHLPPLQFDYTGLALDGTLLMPSGDSLANVIGAFGRGERWMDLDSEGLQGILSEDQNAWYYKRNLSACSPDGTRASARFSQLELVAQKPSAGSGTELQLTSLNGTGNLSAVSFAPPGAGWYERTPEGGWSPFRLFEETANLDWADPNLRFVDLNGDGLADVLITGDHVVTYHAWMVERGFAPADCVSNPYDEDRGPAVVFADGSQTLFLADMSGDGLSDLVRIRSGEVCYWPNLGYGRFGAKIVMDGAPAFDAPDRFDPKRVALGDLDGSGVADLVYFGAGSTVVWLNRSGFGFSAGHLLEAYPLVNEESMSSVFDLLGIGTAAIVWTSPLPGEAEQPVRYIDLTGGSKPYLLSAITNNVGARTELQYSSSTRYYLQDRAAGEPWLTRLPFPVHVVDRVELSDAISRTTTVSTYSYHHGYYDGVEREFRGFARVDHLDADTLPSQSGTGQFTETPHVVGDEFALPPVLTRTWYHTGAFFDREDIAAKLAAEYYQGDPQAAKLGTTALPVEASAEELRQACRALRGRVLRQEIYALDNSPAAVHPYTTAEHRYMVQRIQPVTNSSYAAFYANELDSISSHYERAPDDPRIAHNLTLEVDAYGHVTKQAAVGYPRRNPEFPEQEQLLLRYVEADFRNVSDEPGWYRLGLAYETREFELTGLTPDPGRVLFDPDKLLGQVAAASEIAYEQTPTAGSTQRRLIARARTIYRKDDLSGALPLGHVETLALVDRVYRLAYTAGLLNGLFVSQGKIAGADLATMLTDKGGFVDLDGDGSWWAPSSRMLYSTNPALPEPAFARAHFYLPQGSSDPFGNESSVEYDFHNQLPAAVTDALGNRTSAKLNYRVLQPWVLTDPNLNRFGARFDPLGMVVATASMGKLLPDGSDEGDHLDVSSAEPAAGDDPTALIVYDFESYRSWETDPTRDPNHPVPVSARTSKRVRHKDPATPWIESYAYSDGQGRLALTKAQAEPGAAPERDAQGELVRDASGNLIFAATDHRWVCSGRVIYNNKGNPIKAYEPFFDSSPVYDDETDLVHWGVTAISRYDPLSRVVRIDNPNGSYRTVELHPWRQLTYDENDSVIQSVWYANRQGLALGPLEAAAAAQAAASANTPSVVDFDTLGRTFRSTEDNGAAGRYTTVSTLDITGQVRVTTDPLGRAALSQDYSVTGQPLRHISVDAGERWSLVAADGRLMTSWNSRGIRVDRAYDQLRRPTATVATGAPAAARTAELTTYGESLADAVARNLLGSTYKRFDEAGVAIVEQRDFDGNVITSARQFLSVASTEPDWNTPLALNPETFTTVSIYDALGRAVAVTTPDGSVTSTTFGERNLVTGVAVLLPGSTSTTSVVSLVAYDAKAQRQSVSSGNGTVTTYTYDRETFRLVGILTTRPRSASPLQDLEYTYDAVGNVTHVRDGAQPTIFFSNQAVTPDAHYFYDAIYRLVQATGREHLSASLPQTTPDDSGRVSVPLPTDGQKMQNYTERYAYDDVGNFQSVRHIAAVGSWTRTYAYDEPTTPSANNRLTSTTVGATIDRYTYDAVGNVMSMPHLSSMAWDWRDMMQAAATQAVAGTPPTSCYFYDQGSERVQKLTLSAHGTLTSARLYLGSYEVYREYSLTGGVTLERQSLHVNDGSALRCLVETTTVNAAAAATATVPTTDIRYQLDNHLGSALLELDRNAAVLTYEEYFPYGATSFLSGASAAEVSLKRYRYASKERDVETGFYYLGARYYVPWLGRWLSCDPLPRRDGRSLYAYGLNNPVRFTDRSGADDDDQTQPIGWTPGRSSGFSMPEVPRFKLRPPNFYNASTAQGAGVMEPRSLDVEAFGLVTGLSLRGIGGGGSTFGLGSGGLALRQQVGAPGFDVGVAASGSTTSTAGPSGSSTSDSATALGTIHYGYVSPRGLGLAGYAQAGVTHLWGSGSPQTGLSLALEPALSYETEEGLLAGLYLNPLLTFAGVGSLSQGPTLANVLGLGANAAGQLRLNDQFGLLGEAGFTHNAGDPISPGGQGANSWAARIGVALTFSFRSTSAPSDTSSVAAGAWWFHESGTVTGPAMPGSPSGGFTTNGVIFGLVFGYRRPPENDSISR